MPQPPLAAWDTLRDRKKETRQLGKRGPEHRPQPWSRTHTDTHVLHLRALLAGSPQSPPEVLVPGPCVWTVALGRTSLHWDPIRYPSALKLCSGECARFPEGCSPPSIPDSEARSPPASPGSGRWGPQLGHCGRRAPRCRMPHAPAPHRAGLREAPPLPRDSS